jgi:hypothetical protein
MMSVLIFFICSVFGSNVYFVDCSLVTCAVLASLYVHVCVCGVRTFHGIGAVIYNWRMVKVKEVKGKDIPVTGHGGP